MSTTLDEFTRRRDEIRQLREELWEEMLSLQEIKYQAGGVGPTAEAAEQRINVLRARRDALRKEYDRLTAERDAELDYSVSGFTRPTNRFMNLLHRPMGPLPKRAMVIEPTKEAFGEVGSYWVLALVTMLVAIGSLVALVTFVPGMATSPYSLTCALLLWLTGDPNVAGLLAGSIFVLILHTFGIKFKHSPSEGRFFARAAMVEEQWFRMGAENWTWKQRVYSCLAFGFVHVFNFIYPVASLLVVGVVVGGVAMAVYLREYARTGDTRLATLAAAKFHRTYNHFAVAYMAVALGCVGFFALFTFIS